jgi:hypothetical protein
MMTLGTESTLMAVILVVALASTFDFTEIPSGAERSARVLAFVATVCVCLAWAWCTSHINAKTAASEVKTSAERLKSALALYPAECARVGLTQPWYDAVHAAISPVALLGRTGLIACIALAIYWVLPSTLVNVVGGALQSGWERCLDSYSPEVLVTAGIFGGFVVTYWTVCACFVTLDLLRPASLMPFKVQPDFVLTFPGLAKIVAVALCNQVLVLLSTVTLQAFVLPTVAPDCMLARSRYPACPRSSCTFSAPSRWRRLSSTPPTA